MTQGVYFPSPSSTAALPENAAVIRCLCGDSLGSGTVGATTTVASLAETHVRGGAPTTTALERSDAYYWSKWYKRNAGNRWSGEYRNTETSEATNDWLALHDRTGYNGGPGAEVLDPPGPVNTWANLGDAPSLGLLWVMHYFANSMPRYRTAGGVALPIHYIQHSTSSSLVGPFGANENASWSPTHAAGLFELWQANYLAPAVNKLRGDGKEVFIESMFFTAGGADGSAAGGTPGGENLGMNLEVLLAAMGERSGGRIPTVLIRPYLSLPGTFPDWEEAQASFDEQFDQFADPMVDYIRMEGIPRVETWPGVHPTSDGLVMMAQRYAEAVNRLASRGARLVRVTGDLA